MANGMQWRTVMTVDVQVAQRPTDDHRGDLAIMMTGGGARAAYQVGLLKGLSRHFPWLRFQIITGVSAGAINAVFLASRLGGLSAKTEELEELWCELTCHHIYRLDMAHLIPFRSALASLFPKRRWTRPRGIADTKPLSELLYKLYQCEAHQPIEGIRRNIESGELHAVALMTLDYTTGQSVRWFQGRHAGVFEGPNRRSEKTQITCEHVLASSALPFVFPAVKIDNRWYGDGGIRLSSPLSPAVHLGAQRIIAMSTGYQRTEAEASTPVVEGYPPVAQVLGQLVNAVFLDAIDEDVARMERMNEMLKKMDPGDHNGFKPIDLLVLRPSVDLGKLATEYEKYLPRDVKLLTRALGARETDSPDFVSLLMFEPNYTRRLIDIGEADVTARVDEIRAFLGPDARSLRAAT